MAKRASITVLVLTVIMATSLRGPAAPAGPANPPVKSAAKTAAGPQAQTTPAPAMVRTYGAYWEVGNGAATTLLLKNRDQQNSVTANVTLFSDAGQRQTAQVQVGPGGTSRLNLADVVKPLGTAVQSGGLAVESTGALSGRVTIEGQPNRSFNLGLQGGYRYDNENALYAPWWLPDDGADGRLTVFNSSSQSVTVTPALSVAGGTEEDGNPFTLAPFASATLGLRHLAARNRNVAGGAMGMVTLRYNGPARAILPTLLLSNPATGFSLAPGFNARHQQPGTDQVTWQYPDVALAMDTISGAKVQSLALTAYALLTNGTKSSLAPQMAVFFADGKRPQKKSLFLAPLAPSETRLVDLSQLLAAASVPAGASHFAFTVTHGGVPGDLAVAVFSASEDGSAVLSSGGITQPAGVVDSSFWKLTTPEAVPGILNKNKVNAQAQVTMYYPTGTGLESYLLPVIAVPAGKSQPLGLREIMNSGIADAAGDKIPSGVAMGLVTLTLVNGNAGNGGSTLPPESGPECRTDCNAEGVQAAALVSPSPSVVAGGAQSIVPVSGVQFDSTGCVPVIDKIDPSSGVLGTTSLPVVITGSNFEDGDMVTVTGGITADPPAVSPDGTTMSTNFNIPNNASVGGQTVMITNDPAGNSNSVTFTVSSPPAPVLESVNPASGTAGTATQKVLIDLTAKAPFHDGDTINVTGGITATYSSSDISPDGVQVNATFNIPACAATGDQQVTVTDFLGQASNALTFTVNSGPAPSLTSVNPTTLQAGATTTLTIQGSNINCNPMVSSGDTFISFGQATFTDETQTAIKVDATVDPNDPGGQVQLFVNTSSNGGGGNAAARPLNGGARVVPGSPVSGSFAAKAPGGGLGKASGPSAPPVSAGGSTAGQSGGKAQIISGPKANFSSGGGGGTSNGLAVMVTPIAAPTPQIMFLGMNIGVAVPQSPNPQTVYIGQQIILNAQINLPAGVRIASENWSTPADQMGSMFGSLPQGTAVAGYDDQGGVLQPPQPSPAGGHVEVLQPSSCGTAATCAYNTFYWVDQGTNRTFTFTYQLANQQQASATATFNVKGPTQQVQAAATTTTFVIQAGNPPTPTLKFGDGTPANIGIKFTFPALAGADPGAWIPVQVLSEDMETVLTGAGTFTCVAPAFNQGGTPLDTAFPYPLATPTTTNDGPALPLLAQAADMTRTFSAKMYLLWDPGLKADGTQGCHPASSKALPPAGVQTQSKSSDCTGSIPVPLGSWSWAVSCDAINTLSTNLGDSHTTWKRGCTANTQNPPFSPGIQFPTWSTAITSGAPVQCHH